MHSQVTPVEAVIFCGGSVVILLILVASLGWCSSSSDEEHAKNAAKTMGFKDVEITGRSVFFNGCGEDDLNGFEARGKNVNGEVVNFTVCCGIGFKGCTVRY